MTAYSVPSNHPRISQKEKDYLKNNAVHNEDHLSKGTKLKVPWFGMLKSKPLWAIMISHIAEAWGYYLISLTFPLYAKEVLKLSTTKVVKIFFHPIDI